jgi:DNA primase
MDVIGLYEYGIKNAVASSGTAFTQEQLRKILNYTNKVYIVFDGDEAGMKASWRTVENSMMLLREDTRINFIFLDEGDDPDSYIKSNGKDAFLNLAKNSTSLSDYFFDTVKSYDDLSSIEGRTAAAKYALPLIKSVTNETIKQAYIKEMSKICDLDFSKLIDTNQNKPSGSFNKEKKSAVKYTSNSILIKSVVGIFTSLIQHPKLAELTMFNNIKKDSRFSFILEVKNLYIENPSSAASVILEKINDEKIRNLFGEASVSSIQLSAEDAKLMVQDCLNVILRTGLDNQEREEALKEKYSMEALSLDEKRELQQILLKKDKMSVEEASLLKNLSSK